MPKTTLFGAVDFARRKTIAHSSITATPTLNSQSKKTVNLSLNPVKFKITPPIILFIIDNSGSMHQSIFSNMKYANNPLKIAEARKNLSSKFHDILK